MTGSPNPIKEATIFMTFIRTGLRAIAATGIAAATSIGIAAGVAFAHDYQEVQSGDTLSEIAADNGTTWKQVYEWNSDQIDNPDLIYPGQRLVVGDVGEQRQASADKPDRSERDAVESDGQDSDQSSDGGQNDQQASGGKQRPATGGITSNYLGGYRSNGGHSGTDFAGADGNAYAAAAGTVVSGQWDGAYGNKLVISHGGGVETWYAHLASFAVSAGQEVSAGQKVGDIGSTGNTTGPHLHFEVRINGEMTDPLAWLDR